MSSFKQFIQIGIALDPIHVGTGGARIGRVDLTIVREPATCLPKIPGSSLAGAYRTYVAMEYEELRLSLGKCGQNVRQKPYFPDCTGLGQSTSGSGHCGQPTCPVCTVFGFARGKDQAGGFAGLAAFSDAQVLLFPVPTRRGPFWVTCPMALRQIGLEVSGVTEDAVYLGSTQQGAQQGQQPQQQTRQASPSKLNLGWLFLETKHCGEFSVIQQKLRDLQVTEFIRDHIALLPDRLFIHVVNSNLEVRTSVSINPKTGAAEEGALFSYEALPRSSVLLWEIIAKNPIHYKVEGKEVDVTLNVGTTKMDDPEKVHQVVRRAHRYLEHLGIGGMGTRGMGRLRVLYPNHQGVPGEKVSWQ